MCILLYLLDLPSLVSWYSRQLCLIDLGVNLPCIYVHYAISARAATFGVEVFKASILDFRGIDLPCIYVHCVISARSAKFGVAVFKASMLD